MKSLLQWRSAGIALLSLLVVASLPVPANPSRQDAEEEPSTVKLGKKIDNVVLSDGAGKTLSLYDLKASKAVVIFFLSFECPVANLYRPTMIKLHEEYRTKGVGFIGICPTEDDPAKFAKLLKEYTFPFPVFMDAKLVAADALAAEITPEAFLLDNNFILRYRGRIDSSWRARLKKGTEFVSTDLKNALDEFLAGKRIGKPATVAIGCPIIRPSAAKAGTAAVTYHRDVLPILQKHCQNCHRPGGAGPFSLVTHQQAARWSQDIKKFTRERQMPPWQASAGVSFTGEMKLGQKEIDILTKWVDLGSPEGDPKDGPPPVSFSDGWQLGKPDLVLDVGADFSLAATGADDMARVFPLKSSQYLNKRIAAVEILPSNKRVVRSAAVFLFTPGKGKAPKAESARKRVKDDKVDHGPGYEALSGPGFIPAGLLGTYEPGQPPRRLPRSYLLSGGKDAPTLVLQVHYHRSGKVEKDRPKVGLYFSRDNDNKSYQGLVMTANPAVIPAGAANHRFVGRLTLDRDCEIYSIMPCMSFLGKNIKVTMTLPGGIEQTLVAINSWDPHWQQTCYLTEPIKAKAGTHFTLEAHFNNSIENARNPFRPPRPMRLGHGVGDEQCAAFLGVTTEKPFIGALVFNDGTPPAKGKKGK